MAELIILLMPFIKMVGLGLLIIVFGLTIISTISVFFGDYLKLQKAVSIVITVLIFSLLVGMFGGCGTGVLDCKHKVETEVIK